MSQGHPVETHADQYHKENAGALETLVHNPTESPQLFALSKLITFVSSSTSCTISALSRFVFSYRLKLNVCYNHLQLEDFICCCF